MATLTLLVGIPGSGKSTYAKTKIDRRCKIVSSDAIRKELFFDEADQEHNDIVFKTLYERARNFLIDGKDVVIDATNSTIENRKLALSHFSDLNIKRKAIVIETPLENCITYDKKRRRIVGEKIINEFAESYTFPTKEEGFDDISVVKNTEDGFMKFLKTTVLVIVKDGKIMLARKKRGFGAGLYNGVGGKVECGESVEEAMIRETKEEANIIPTNYKKCAEINFDEFVKDEPAFVNMHIFLATDYIGTPEETEEMIPTWFDLSKIPYSRMFPDDTYWLPEVLKGNKVKAFFKYDVNLNILEKEIKITTEDFV